MTIRLALVLMSIFSFHKVQSKILCAEVFQKKEETRIRLKDQSERTKEFLNHVEISLEKVTEFRYLRQTAQEMGLRVWLFGGTASSFLDYVRRDFLQNQNLTHKEKKTIDDLIDKENFDFDLINIFRSTQDLDIVIDGDLKQLSVFRKKLFKKFPYFLGSQSNGWEVRSLLHRKGEPGHLGFKEALLQDTDFSNQNTDSYSLGLVEVTKSSDPVVRDLKSWNHPKGESIFLQDVLNQKIHYFWNPQHGTTLRARNGENPEILSVLRFLVKVFQYELTWSQSDLLPIQKIIEDFNPASVHNSLFKKRLEETVKKFVLHSINLELTMNTLDHLGLRQKLKDLGDTKEVNSLSWWLNKEPLRSYPLGRGSGARAGELGIQLVSHETHSLLAYESMVRGSKGQANVFISRQDSPGELAAYGDGFYTRLGREGARGTGLTVRFHLHPQAREGTDFIVEGTYVLVKNKAALKRVQESWTFTLEEILHLSHSEEGLALDIASNLGLLDLLNKRLSGARVMEELDQWLHSSSALDYDRFLHVLGVFHHSPVAKLISPDLVNLLAQKAYARVNAFASPKRITSEYLRTVGPIVKTLDTLGLVKTEFFIKTLLLVLQKPETYGWSLREEAFYEALLHRESIPVSLNLKQLLTPQEWTQVVTKIHQWRDSQDPRKRDFFKKSHEKWIHALEKGNLVELQLWIDLEMFSFSYHNISGVSLLSLASYYGQSSVVSWLLSQPGFDHTQKNRRGLTPQEELLFYGQESSLALFQKLKPETPPYMVSLDRHRDSKNWEYPQGRPRIAFVLLESGSFMMGEASKKVTVTLSQSIEVLSVDTTQFMYKSVVELCKEFLPYKESALLNPKPAEFQDPHRPVERVSYHDVTLWLQGLNELSLLDSSILQKKLEDLFPGHQKGYVYTLPTEAQWEFVSRLGGFAESFFSYGSQESLLNDYAVHLGNSGFKTSPVGLKKPVFYQGHPLYDLHGNIWRWTLTWYDSSLPSGVDPLGPAQGFEKILRGGSWGSQSFNLYSSSRSKSHLHHRDSQIGFRLFRIPKKLAISEQSTPKIK
jgi:hypothetical protein